MLRTPTAAPLPAPPVPPRLTRVAACHAPTQPPKGLQGGGPKELYRGHVTWARLHLHLPCWPNPSIDPSTLGQNVEVLYTGETWSSYNTTVLADQQ
jgi:hypothetical protein